MYKPQASALSFIQMPPPRLNYPIMKLIRLIIKPYMRSLTFYDPEILFPERFVKAYKKCTDKKIRLILAFRHAYGDDPQLMAALMHYSLPRYAKKIGIALPKFTHAHFIYGAEVPMWSDASVLLQEYTKLQSLILEKQFEESIFEYRSIYPKNPKKA